MTHIEINITKQAYNETQENVKNIYIYIYLLELPLKICNSRTILGPFSKSYFSHIYSTIIIKFHTNIPKACIYKSIERFFSKRAPIL